MRKLIFLIFAVIVLSAISSCKNSPPATLETLELSSPDGRNKLNFQISKSSKNGFRYSLFRNNNPIIIDSLFSLEFADQAPFKANLNVLTFSRYEKNTSWQRVWGKSKNVVDHYKELVITLKEEFEPRREIQFIARAYNDGIALRYGFPEQASLEQILLKDETLEFKFASDFKVWATKWKSFYDNQEAPYIESPISKLKQSNGEVIGTPLVIDAEKAGFAAIFEANLTDWSGMTLHKSHSRGLRTELAHHSKARQDIKVISKAPRLSPWRVIMLGDDEGKLIESNLLHNLNAPNAIGNTEWIEPGISAWDWWWAGSYAPDANFKLGSNTETMKYYIDLAAEMGWEYQLVDWHWYGNPFITVGDNKRVPNPNSDITQQNPDIDIKELVAYAEERNVRLMLWLDSNHAAKQMSRAFPVYKEWGIAGVKIDFMRSIDQDMVNFYHEVMQTAAKSNLLVNMHGSYMPTGISRTYPNFMTREGVMGNEHNKWSKKITPEHTTTLPFTRMLLGHMDFTPGGFLQQTQESFRVPQNQGPATHVYGTRAMQLAMLVVYESSLQVMCDSPYNYRKHPAGTNFLKMVPTTWDETRVLQAKIGDYVSVARRSGNDWYIGTLNDWDERELELRLDFLPEGTFKAQIWMDGEHANENPMSLAEQELHVTNASTITANLAKGGGHIIRIYLE